MVIEIAAWSQGAPSAIDLRTSCLGHKTGPLWIVNLPFVVTRSNRSAQRRHRRLCSVWAACSAPPSAACTAAACKTSFLLGSTVAGLPAASKDPFRGSRLQRAQRSPHRTAAGVGCRCRPGGWPGLNTDFAKLPKPANAAARPVELLKLYILSVKQHVSIYQCLC